MTRENQVVLISGPGGEDQPMPSMEAVRAVMADIVGKEMAPYEDGDQDAPLIAELPRPGSVVDESFREDIGLTTWTLSNGITVLLKPTDFKADEILISAWSPGGASLAPDSMYISSSLTTNIIGGSGVGSFNAVDLSKKLSGKVARIRPYIGSLEEGFSGSATPQDLETLFQLAHLYATAPRADSTVFASFMTRMNSMLSTLQNNPLSAFGDTLNVTLNDYHFRARPMSADVLAEADLTHMESLYADRFADFSDFTFLIVGTFNPQDMRPLVEQYLASLPGMGRKEAGIDVGIRPPAGAIEKEVYRGVEPVSQVGIVFSGEMPWTMESRRAMDMLRETLDTRLREVLREDLGGTYDVSVQGSLSDQPYEYYQFVIVFGCDPERVEELVAMVWDTIRSFQELGPEEEDLANAREQAFRSWETGLEENGFWLNSIEFYTTRGMDPARILINPAEALGNVTPAQVAGMARKVLRDDQYVRVTLYPESTDL